MKFAVFGLGNFGSNLALSLVQLGHEVIGVDNRMDKIEELKEQLTYVVCFDTTVSHSVNTLPMKDVDVAVVCIGENEGDSLMTAALLRQMKVKRIISRAISPLHRTVLESIGVEEIINPERDSAETLARRLTLKNIINAFDLPEDYSIAEVIAPDEFAEKSILSSNIKEAFRLNVVTIIRKENKKNLLGMSVEKRGVLGVVSAETVIKQGDVLVVFGAKKDIQKLSSLDL
ncbi:MAG: TrkA family potassium uptake protein [Chitinophagales bacterium]|nr:TrkA family potassium uptake protein [Chitinophagales bacterium]